MVAKADDAWAIVVVITARAAVTATVRIVLGARATLGARRIRLRIGDRRFLAIAGRATGARAALVIIRTRGSVAVLFAGAARAALVARRARLAIVLARTPRRSLAAGRPFAGGAFFTRAVLGRRGGRIERLQ